MTTKHSQYVSSETLAAILSSAARVAVLRVFMLDPLRAYYQRQLEVATGIPIRAVQRELERMSSVDLLYRHMEGNRAYYKVDMQFPLFPELRGMILKSSDDTERLRGHLALVPSVRLAFRRPADDSVLVVFVGEAAPRVQGHDDFSFEMMSEAEFVRTLEKGAESIKGYLDGGEDLLGRRDDIIWRRIEAAGFDVKKGKGIP